MMNKAISYYMRNMKGRDVYKEQEKKIDSVKRARIMTLERIQSLKCPNGTKEGAQKRTEDRRRSEEEARYSATKCIRRMSGDKMLSDDEHVVPKPSKAGDNKVGTWLRRFLPTTF